jgi:Flp pilus assembly pilin Flp
MLKKLAHSLKRLHNDDRGAEGLEKLLIVGAIVIPLLGILIYFKDEVAEWLGGLWEEVRDDNTNDYEYDGN